MEEMLWHTKRWPETVKKSLDYPDEPLFALLDNVAAFFCRSKGSCR
ncbi:MAG: hypothetical protein ACW99X_15475 [Candidatus Thorarchaeota archaeon]